MYIDIYLITDSFYNKIEMLTIKMPISRLNLLIKKQTYVGASINFDVLNELGFFIVRGVLPIQMVAKYKTEYDNYKISKEFDRTPFHLTEVKVNLEHPMAEIIREPSFIKIVQEFFGGNVGLFNIRIVKKDLTDVKPVFLHQDVGYQHGSFSRYSIFIPLTDCNRSNGGLSFIPGTHKFGYLGDAGELNDVAPAELIRPTPAVSPGDLIVMNSALWHMSGANETQAERVYYDIHINHAEDTATKYKICGVRESEWALNYDQNFLFKTSRTQRLRALYNQLDELRVKDDS